MGYNEALVFAHEHNRPVCADVKDQMTTKPEPEQRAIQKKIISLGLLILSDLGMVILSYCLAFQVRSNLLPQFMQRFQEIGMAPFANFLNHFYLAGIWIVIFAHEKLYIKRYTFHEEIKHLLKSTTIASSAVMILIFMTRTQIEFSRAVVILAWLFTLALLPLSRYLIKTLLVRTNLWKKKLIILGVQQTSLMVLQSIQKNKTMGYEVLGFLDDDPKKRHHSYLGVEVLGPLSDLEEITETHKSKDIMIATPHLPRHKLRELLTKFEESSESMWLIPRSGDFITAGVELDVLDKVIAIYIKKNLAKPWNVFIKKAFELTLAVSFAVLILPFLAIISLAIKLDSRGSVFYIQQRLGRNKMPFRLYKFRTMHTDGDKRLEAYLQSNQEAKAEWQTYKKLKKWDPRVTRVGKFLRMFSLDELPQLFNVLQGKMSLVGPRPYLPDELEGRDVFKDKIALVKPGITGLWQISGRSELPFEKRISLDEYYIRNWSLWLDITILFKSVIAWLSRKGAY